MLLLAYIPNTWYLPFPDTSNNIGIAFFWFYMRIDYLISL